MVQFDEIGYWSELKIEIVEKYARAYSRILNAQHGLEHVYVDAFAGPGVHMSRARSALVPGSPLNALHVDPPFKRNKGFQIQTHLIGSIGYGLRLTPC